MCLVWGVVVMLLAINITPTFSTLTRLEALFNWNFHAAHQLDHEHDSKLLTHLSSELDNIMLLCTFDCQETRTPKRLAWIPSPAVRIQHVHVIKRHHFPGFVLISQWFQLQPKVFSIIAHPWLRYALQGMLPGSPHLNLWQLSSQSNWQCLKCLTR